MLEGVGTIFASTTGGGQLGFLYQSRTALVIFGLIFFFSGLAIFAGKLFKKRRLVGWGLMATFACFLFGAILSGIAYPNEGTAWIPNFVAALVVGVLYLWWRFKTAYIDVGNFRKISRQHRR